MWTHPKTAIIGLAGLILSTLPATAMPVSTGLTGVGTIEGSWTVSSPVFDGAAVLYVVEDTADYGDAWANAPGLSNWITPYPDATSLNTLAADDPNSPGSPPQDVVYTYTLNFTQPVTDVLIRWASDNGAEFRLNGDLLDTIFADDVGDTPFAFLQAFNIAASVFDAGINTFTVAVTNLSYGPANPTGLLVDVSAVPLPPAALLFGSALLGLNWLRRRRSSSSKLGAMARP